MTPKIKLTRDSSGWIVAEDLSLPGCITQGRNEDEARAHLAEARAAWLWAEQQKRPKTAPCS